MFDLQALLKQYHPDLYERQFTEQYALGEKILDYLFEYKLEQSQMADMMGVDLSTYLKMESVLDDFPVERYLEAIRLFEARVK